MKNKNIAICSIVLAGVLWQMSPCISYHFDSNLGKCTVVYVQRDKDVATQGNKINASVDTEWACKASAVDTEWA